MSNKNQETIADIVSAMRNEGHTGEASCLEWIRTKMTYYADRIEAAEKREREATRAKSSQVGNAVAMREALVRCADIINKFGLAEIVTTPMEVICDIEGIITAALSAPPRNCDRPECATTDAAQEVWRKEDGGKTAYYEWLLATSTAKGETDGSK